ncbi:hypothetical protein [Rufibacter sp. LB8]|uniref:hypothetical protein n=1 Tax=Rufibacter sp. LB8 TaxID=2777781 RepID=UPI00178C7BF4|nr:hypothetical protein [Rufibacter sp. LB8]
MKSILAFLLVFCTWVTCYGQTNPLKFSPIKLKGYKTIIETHVKYFPLDSTITKTVYEINQLGKVTRNDSYKKEVKVSFEKFLYSNSGQLLSKETHNQIYAYDEQAKDHVPSLPDDFYHLTTYEYKAGKLNREKTSYVAWGSASLNGDKRIEYDKNGRVIKEISTNLYTGLVGAFASNSDVLDSIYYKGEADRSIIAYQYGKNLVIENQYDTQGKIAFVTRSKLNIKGQVVAWETTDKDGVKVLQGSKTYDSMDNLVKSQQEIIEKSRLEGDVLAGDRFEYQYNGKGLLSSYRIYQGSRLLSKGNFTYK